jgi:hypothetical protein
MRHTGWLSYFVGKDIRKIALASRPPTRDDPALFRVVSQSIDRVFESCVDVVKMCKGRRWTVILRWMHTFVKAPLDKRPFRIDYADGTHVKYTREWVKLVCYCLRAMDEPEIHQHKFREEELSLLQKVRDAASSPDVDESSLDRSIFQLSVCLIQHGEEQQESTLMHFTAVLGIRKDTGGFLLAGAYTPHLAGIVYCMRLLMLKHALPPDVVEGPNPTQRVIEVHHRWLVDDEQSPFSDISSLLAYGRGAGMAGGRPSVTWSEDSKVMWFHGRRIEMATFRKFIHAIVDEAEKVLSEVICDEGAAVIRSIDLRLIGEDMTEERAGHSFVRNEENRLIGGAGRVLDRMKKLPGFGAMLEAGPTLDSSRFKLEVIKRIQTGTERFCCEYNP